VAVWGIVPFFLYQNSLQITKVREFQLKFVGIPLLPMGSLP